MVQTTVRLLRKLMHDESPRVEAEVLDVGECVAVVDYLHSKAELGVGHW